MPLEKLALILVSVILAAGLTVWFGVLLSGAVPGLGAVLIPAVLGITLLWRLYLGRSGRKPTSDRDD